MKTDPGAPIASHSKSSDGAAIELFNKIGITPPTIDELDEICGKVIGLVNLVDVIEFETDASIKQDPFTAGPLCFLLEDPRHVEPEFAKGNLRIWSGVSPTNVLH